MKYIYIIICFSVCFSCNNGTKKPDPTPSSSDNRADYNIPKVDSNQHDKNTSNAPKILYTSDTFLLADGTIGYDVKDETGKVKIHQNRIPGLPGNRGFTNAAQANCVAEKMIQKLSQGTFPPSITIEDLNQCGVKTY